MAAGTRIKQDNSISILDTKVKHILVRSSSVTTGMQKRERRSFVRGDGAGCNLGNKAGPEDPQKYMPFGQREPAMRGKRSQVCVGGQ